MSPTQIFSAFPDLESVWLTMIIWFAKPCKPNNKMNTELIIQVLKQYLCFCLVRVLSTYTWSSKCKGLSIAWGRGPWWTSLHIALSAPVRGQGSNAMVVTVNKSIYVKNEQLFS